MAADPGRAPLDITDRDVATFGLPHHQQITAAWLMSLGSDHTRRSYLRAWLDFTGWLTERHGLTRPEEVTRGHVDEWRLTLDNTLSPQSVNVRIAAIASWYTYLAAAGVVTGNPTTGVHRTPAPDTGTTPMPATDHLLSVLNWVDRHETVANRVAVHLLARYALRVAEVCALRTRDVNVDSSGVTCLTIRCKGGRHCVVRVAGDLGATIARLADWRDGSLLRNVAGPITPRTVTRCLQRACAALDLPVMHPHMLRTWAITTALDQGANIDDVASFARHRSVQTTRRYDRNPERRRDEIAGLVANVLTKPSP